MSSVKFSASRLGCVVVLLLALGPARILAAGPDEELEFDLQGGPLSNTLLAIARQAGTVISFKPALVDPHVAPPIRGRFTLERALALATQAAGLTVERTSGGTMTVLPAAPVVPVAASAPIAATQEARASEPAAARLPPVVVLGSGLPRPADGLRALRGWSATRSDTPLADLPQTISVLTSEAITLQGAATSTEALRYVTNVDAGVDAAGSGGLLGPGVLVRGLPATFALSGMRSVRGVFPAEAAFIERIEVPKGPSSVIGGIADFGGRGGVVNLVRKQAGPEVRTEFSQSLSSQDSGTLRLGADLGGRLGATGPTWWRVIGYGSRTGQTEGGYSGQNSSGLLGTLSYQGQDLRATVTLQADQRRSTPAPASRGGLRLEDGSFTPVEQGVLEPPDPEDRLIVRSADMELELDWRFAPGWRTTWKGRVEGLRADLRRLQPFNEPQRRQNEAWNAAMQWGVVHDFSTGPARHQLLLGFDLDRSRTVQKGINADVNAGDSGVTIDTLEFKQAVLLQDQVSLGGLRLRASVQRSLTPLFDETGLVKSNTGRHLATNWDLGALYRVTPWASVYAGTQYAVETDHRQAGLVLDDGSTPPPTALRQFQAGAKFQLFERRMDLGVEAFRLRQTDKLYTLAAALPGRFVDGAELELSGRPRPGLDLSLGLAVARGTDFVVDANGASGFEVPAVSLPWGSLYLLGSYQLPQALLSQSRLVVGYRAQSSKWAVAPNPLSPQSQLNLPGGARLDLALDRMLGPLTLSLFVRNVFDRQIYGGAPQSDPRYLPLEPGRSIGLTAVYKED